MAKYLVQVKPGSSQLKIIQNTPSELTVYFHAKAHDSEANDALINMLAKHYDVPKTTIRIIRGQKSRTKLVEF